MATQGGSVGSGNTRAPHFHFHLTDAGKAQRSQRDYSGPYRSLLVGLGCKPDSRVYTLNPSEIRPRAPAGQQDEEAGLH